MPSHMDPFQTNPNDIKDPKIHIMNFQISRRYVLIHWKGVFPKVMRLGKMMQNRVDNKFWGQTFTNTHLLFQFKVHDKVHDNLDSR